MTDQTEIERAGKQPTRPRALLLVNPQARTAADRFDEAVRSLEAAGVEVVTPDLDGKNATGEAIDQCSDSCDLVIVAGGDGSLHAALQHLVGKKLPLGILPLGTANDLAKSLGVPTDLSAACAVIAAGVTRRIDVGSVNGTYFFNEMSIGMSTTVSRLLTKDVKAKLGVFALLYRAIQVLRRMRRFAAQVECDGTETVLRTVQLTIGNSQSFGGFVASDEASLDDHKLDLYSVSFRYWWSFAEALQAMVLRRYDDARSVVTMHGKAFDIHTKRPRPIEADGEIVSMTPAKVRVVPNAISIFVPAAQA